MKYLSLPAAVLLASSAVAAQAQTSSDTLLVTATRTAQTADQALASVSVIDRAEIERKQAQTVTELLESTPGLTLINNGGRGKATSISLRGTSSGHVLVLIDGIKAGSATLGTTAFEHLAVDQIERIEVVRGARSSLYGANAIGGVIQIFTKQPKQAQSYGEVLAGYGSNNALQTALSGGWSNSQSQISAKVSHFSTDGFDVRPEKASKGVDDDGYVNDSLKLDGQHKLGKHTLSAGLQYTKGENEYDGSSSNDSKSEFEYSTAYAGIKSKLTESFTLKSKLSSNKDDSLTVVDGADGNSFITKTQKLEVQGEQKYENGILVIAGLDYKIDDVSESTQDYDEESRDNKALFALIEKTGDKYQASLSVRVDDNEAFGDFTTYGIDGQYELSPQASISAGYATAFLAPTFNQLYWPDTGYGGGNPDLKPETSSTASVGLTFKPKSNLDFGLNLYQTELKDMISGWPAENTDKAEITGAEFLANASFGPTQLSFNANLLDTEDKKTGKELTYRAQKTANLRISQQLNQLTVGLDTQFSDERYTNTSNTEKLPAYTLYNLDAKYSLSKQLNLSASIKNLTDKEYETNKGYATAGRTVFGSVRYRF